MTEDEIVAAVAAKDPKGLLAKGNSRWCNERMEGGGSCDLPPNHANPDHIEEGVMRWNDKGAWWYNDATGRYDEPMAVADDA